MESSPPVESSIIDSTSSADTAELTTSAEDQKNVARMKNEMAQAAKATAKEGLPPAASVVPNVDIAEGRFKYVLLEVTDREKGIKTFHTRSAMGSYHANVAGAS